MALILQNPLHYISEAAIVEEDKGYGYWLYIKSIYSFSENVRNMNHYVDTFKSEKAAKMFFTKQHYKGVWK